ncbi:hypothetical protein PR202_gb04561 [Eleusine coracana subsp. coracana]|uniref:Protein kinase domain-containing protein n=1 Tax=Eleusine coracana subsp. coracana TaxID=191504 RepID=A0AAV5E4U1_ELECO|nr:hypothetical protein PR202_gb04561 [Eleusine coracana subsp. coracana]
MATGRIFPLLLAAAALLLVQPASPFSFTYNFTSPSDTPPPGIAFQGTPSSTRRSASPRDERLGPITSSAGRAFYARAVPLADPVSRRPASFATAFAFSIAAPDPAAASGDGLAFFLSPNDWDPSDDHVGVDLGGIVSAATADWPTSMKDGRRAHARVEYDAVTRNLTVALAYGDDRPAVLLWHAVDLRDYLPDSVAVGFSAAMGEAAELHQVLYWEFTSTVDPKEKSVVLWVVLGLCALLLALVAAGVVWFVKEWRKAGEQMVDGDIDIDDVMGGDYDELADEFVVETGPRRFRYGELAAATRNFAEDRKLGQGGFGAVYRGYLKELGLQVAIKRVSRGSTQGRKEYAAEVRIISQLRHRHLVRLVGWCHDRRGDFLLVYEHMPNGSVDHHLYGKGKGGAPLAWPTRYDVVLGLASAVLYLHEECAQCVVHRDIKPSNVMLDAAFSAKLGDFGLAKLVEHGSQPYTTVLAGTLGYLAPECVMTGKASRESDVYSFGVVALEIACGAPAEPNEEPSKARLVPWVWELPSIRQALNVLKFEAPLPVLPPKMPVPTYFPPLPELADPISVQGTTTTDGPGQWIQNAPTEKLHLPKPNIFIPKDLSLKEVHEKVWVGGYNDKMRVLLNAILKQISNFEVKPSRFSALKETSVKDYQNFSFNQPHSQASYYVSLILEDKRWPRLEKLEALSKLDSDSLAKFVPHLLSKTFLECYIQGNIEPSEAKSIIHEIEDITFNSPNSLFKSMSPSQYLTKRVIMLENELKCYYQIEGLNKKNENSSLVQYIQVHQEDAISNVKLELFSLIASQPAFNQLRTIEQLGYIASLSLRYDYGVWALHVVIQSTVKDPSYLDTRVDEFFKTFEINIHELSDKDFKVALLRELKKEEFIEFFDQYIKVGAPQRRTISVQVFGCNHSEEFKTAIAEADPPKTYRITDIFGFKRSRPLYSSLKGGPGRITMD